MNCFEKVIYERSRSDAGFFLNVLTFFIFSLQGVFKQNEYSQKTKKLLLMTKKIFGSKGKIVRLFSGRIKKSKTQPSLLVYEIEKKAIVPYDFKVPAYSFYEKLEQHLRNYQTVVPVVDHITWKHLLKYNPALIVMHKNIVVCEGRDFPDQAWDSLALRLVRFLEENHTPVTTQEVVIETTVSL